MRSGGNSLISTFLVCSLSFADFVPARAGGEVVKPRASRGRLDLVAGPAGVPELRPKSWADVETRGRPPVRACGGTDQSRAAALSCLILGSGGC